MSRKLAFTLLFLTCNLVELRAASGPGLHLNEIFVDLHSQNADIRQRASDNFTSVLVEEMPHIESETGVICESLSDQLREVRVSAASALVLIVQAYPEHRSLVSSCAPQLVIAAGDPEDYVRRDALFVMARVPGGPPPQSIPIFRALLHSGKEDGGGLAAIALLHSGSQSDAALVAGALRQERTPESRLSMLRGVTLANTPDTEVYAAVQSLLYDKDVAVREAAVPALIRSAPDRGRAVAALENLRGSEDVPKAMREAAEAGLQSLRGDPQSPRVDSRPVQQR